MSYLAAVSLEDYLLDPAKAAAYDRLGIVGVLIVVLVLVLGGGLALIGVFVGILVRVFTKGIVFLKEQTAAMSVLSERHQALHDANTAALDRFSGVTLCSAPACPVQAKLFPHRPVSGVKPEPTPTTPPTTTP